MISPSDPIEAIRHQKRSESPTFWVIVFAGSLLIHLVLVLGMRSLLLQTVRVPVEPEPISVEFADDATDDALSSQTGSPKPSPSQAAPPKPVSSAPPPAAKSITSSTEIPSNKLQTTSPEATLSIPQPARPVQKSPQFTLPAPSHSRSVSPLTSPPAATNSVPNRVSTTDSMASSLNTRLSSPTINGPIASGVRLPDVPNVPNPADNPGQTTKLSNLPINPLPIAKASTPASFLAQVQLLPIVEKGAIANPTTTPAAIQGEPSKEFISDPSSCLLTPEALSAFGKAVVLRASLDEQGQLQGEPTVLDQSSSGNSHYDDLAACVLKQWTFSPAYDLGDQNIRSPKPGTIHVQVKITSNFKFKF